MKLKFYINSEGKKIYTLKEEVPNSNPSHKTRPAHYKFIKVRNAPKSKGNKNTKIN